MRYEVMGPLRVIDDEGAALFCSRRMRTVLATLLIQCGQLVTMDQLIAEIWGDRAPRQANAAVYVHVSQLRKVLRTPARPDGPIRTEFPGYLIEVESEELDLLVFRRLTAEARRQAALRQYGPAADLGEQALALCRGAAAGVLHDGPIAAGFAAWLGHARLECKQIIVSARLNAGDYAGVIGMLYDCISENPLCEIFYQHLMHALYRSGRRAEALAVYQDARRVLKSELGLEPCRDLENMQWIVLDSDGRPPARRVPDQRLGVAARVTAS